MIPGITGITIRRRSQAFFDSIGHSRRLSDIRAMSALPPIADEFARRVKSRDVPQPTFVARLPMP
jgi:hypothetical protein